MKKARFLIVAAILLVIAVNVHYYYRIYKQQVAFHKEILMRQTQICGWEIEQTGYEFENEINYIVFSTELIEFFNNLDNQDDRIKKLELFYFKYQNLIQNINIIDNNKNVFSLFKDKSNQFLTDFYIAQRQKRLYQKETVLENEDGTYTYILPVFQENKAVLNILIKVDFMNYIQDVFANYHLGSTLWQWVVKRTGEVVDNNLISDSLYVSKLDVISQNLSIGDKGFIQHQINRNNEQVKAFSFYYPTRLLSKDFGIVFSLKSEVIISSIIRNAVLVGASTFLFLVFIIGMTFVMMRRKDREHDRLKQSEEALQMILEGLPIGILIINKKRIVRSLNHTAIEIFGIENKEELIGKPIPEQFFISRNFHDQDSFTYQNNLNQYIYYDDNDNEIILFKKEINTVFNGEEVSLEAFIDITPVEKARKREVAANKAKSEFLAKMSHEIRTPLNGIIGMADTLHTLNLNAKQEEAVQIITKSADLLLSIINDILDFSKIEAGKMIIEETPFQLRDELASTLSLFTPKAKEKGLALESTIAENIPNELIGDPFRLKQVVSNLIGNAIKFTYEGKILVSVELVKQVDRTVIILFNIEDTGIGIAKEKLKDIFGSFSQADGSTTRRFGGTGLGTTISKQLVELMNGEIWVDSPSSISIDPQYKGSRFSFTIQVFSNERFEKNVKIQEITDYSQIRVLIINPAIEKEDVLRTTFSKFGTAVTEITPKQSPIEHIRKNQKDKSQKYHLIIIKDTAEFDGIDLGRSLHKEGISDDFFITIVSSNDQPGNYVKCKMNGIDYYLIKPFEASEVFEIIQENFPNLLVKEQEMPKLNRIREHLRILVAEDNIINQKVALTIFKNLGYDITLAENGADCVRKIKAEPFDILFMDIMMPEKDGLEATAEIRSLGFKLPIVAMTANAREEDKIKAFNSGMNDYLAKPVKIDEIKEVLIKWFSDKK